MEHRRDFLKKMAGFTAGLTLPLSLFATEEEQRDRMGLLLPTRKLGKTGESITMLGIGGFHLHWTTDMDARDVIMSAMRNGVRFFDTAEGYGPQISEIRLGRYLTPRFRDLVYLMTKSQARDPETARKHLEGSLERMKTDYLDLWQMHSLLTPEDVDERIDNGVLDVFIEAKKSGKVRHIGFTGHQNPYAFLRMLERTDDMDIWDAAQMPVNPLDAASTHSFTALVLPELLKRDIGVLAMKTLADGRFFAEKNLHQWHTDNPIIPDVMSIADAQHFAWSLPITTLITGAENTRFLEEKIELAKQFKQLSEEDRIALVERVSDLSVYGSLEYYKRV